MRTPAFYDQVPGLTVYDPLAEFLGAAENGCIEYRYIDAVRLAGHSCPTVASAYWLTLKGLASLYPDSLPQRGGIRVEFRLNRLSGVTGVIANVVAMITGATHDTGFKGIGGRFDRRRLLYFSAEVGEEIRFTRVDTGQAVDVAARLQLVPFAPQTSELMQKCLGGSATPEEAARFRECWQARVRALLLDHGDDPEVFSVSAVPQ
jgi:hypothetical protein